MPVILLCRFRDFDRALSSLIEAKCALEAAVVGVDDEGSGDEMPDEEGSRGSC